MKEGKITKFKRFGWVDKYYMKKYRIIKYLMYNKERDQFDDILKCCNQLALKENIDFITPSLISQYRGTYMFKYDPYK